MQKNEPYYNLEKWDTVIGWSRSQELQFNLKMQNVEVKNEKKEELKYLDNSLKINTKTENKKRFTISGHFSEQKKKI